VETVNTVDELNSELSTRSLPRSGTDLRPRSTIRRVNIAIIGGGIGGLSAALTLRHFGFEPQVFEQAPELHEVGAAIAMWPNALRVLFKLGLGDKVVERAGSMEHVRWLNRDGKALKEMLLPVKEIPAVALHRADLQSTLVRALPESSIHLAHKLVSYQHEGSHIRLNFANQASIKCEALIGADGLHSQVRQQMFDDSGPIYRGYTVWRGITSRGPSQLKGKTAIEIFGRGRRFGIGPVGQERIGWWATANENEELKTEAGDEQQRLKQLFDGWWTPVGQLIAATPGDHILRNPAFDRPPTRGWGIGRITFLGDAIHPTTPNLGQGGCMAIEDAAVLARCLARETEPAQAFRAYEKVRYQRTAAIANYSRLYGNVGQWKNRPGVWLRGAMLASVPKVLATQLLSLIFDYDAFTVRI
jgi:2-polyprenyl-6-methoxyphenol hydroxylase-like FAD-dependent oxidoreductase